MSGLVGREAELAAIGELLAFPPVGVRGLVLEGEAGIGKTVVWEAGLATARRGGMAVLAARCRASETRLSFAALGDLLAEQGQLLEQLPLPQRRAVAGALLVEDLVGEVEPRAIGLGVLGCLRLLAEGRPVLVAFDDLQWLDRPSADALGFALARVAGERVAVLATRRRSEGHPPLALEQVVGADGLRRLELGPLSPGGVHELLRGRLGLSLPRPRLVRLHAACAGNPLFALELGRLLLTGGAGAVAGLPVPADVRRAVLTRLGLLPPRTREALLVVALASAPTLTLVEDVTGRPALADLAAAVEGELVVVDDGRLRFGHPLFAAAMSGSVDPALGRDLHRRLAAKVPDREERARHLARAAEGPEAEAAAALEEAAGLAWRRGALDAHAELLELAASLAGGEDERARLQIEAAAAWGMAEDAERAAALMRALLPGLAPGRRRAQALLELLRSDVDDAATVPLAEEALVEAGEDWGLRARILLELSTHAELAVGLAAARAHAREALVLAERAGDERLLVRALAFLGHLQTLAAGEEWRPLLERARLLGERGEPTRPWFAPGHWIGVRLMWEDRLEEARALLEAEYERAGREGDISSRGGLCFHLAQLETRAGRPGRARAYAEEGYQLGGASGAEQGAATNRYALALVEASFGDAERARSLAAEVLAAFERMGDRFFTLHTRGALALLALSEEDHAAALAALAPARRLREETGVDEPGIFPFDADEIEALVALRRLQEGEELTNELLERGRLLDRPRLLATGLRCRGLLLAARGELDAASATLEQALAAHERLPVPLERARSLLAFGSVQRQAQRKRAAREALEQAAALFGSIGAVRWQQRARTEAARIGGRASPKGLLSATEQRIAALAAVGKTNAEIAAELHLSARTVQWNLSKVYGKLGVRSRTELATARLPPPPT